MIIEFFWIKTLIDFIYIIFYLHFYELELKIDNSIEVLQIAPNFAYIFLISLNSDKKEECKSI